MEGTSTTVPFKNLHSREYQGHKKKVLSLSSLIFNFRFCKFFFFHWGNPRGEEGIDDLIWMIFFRCIRWLGIAPAQSSLLVLSIKPLDFGTLSHTAMYELLLPLFKILFILISLNFIYHKLKKKNQLGIFWSGVFFFFSWSRLRFLLDLYLCCYFVRFVFRRIRNETDFNMWITISKISCW